MFLFVLASLLAVFLVLVAPSRTLLNQDFRSSWQFISSATDLFLSFDQKKNLKTIQIQLEMG